MLCFKKIRLNVTKLDAEETVIEEKNVIVTDATPQGVHGGAWKVAYADFVTAMMAFFLLMWLLNATTEEQRSGIADYFDPKIPISQSSSGGMGMFNGDSVFAPNKLARNGLGGAGKKASAGRDDKQKHEVSSSEDVWRQGKQSLNLLEIVNLWAPKGMVKKVLRQIVLAIATKI